MQKSAFPWGPAPRSLRSDAAKTLADEAYQRIREDIIHGAFVPNQKLQPDVLRERYDIGLSPVREALSRLALDGLAVAEGQRGFFVAPVSKGELLDIADLRIRFAVLAVERSLKIGDDKWENRVVTTYYQLNKIEKQLERDPATYADEWERRNRAFHLALESGCNSPWLIHFCEMLYDQLERYRRLFVSYPSIDPSIYDEHRAIMECALSRDEKACELLAKHFTHASEIIHQLIEKAEESAEFAAEVLRAREARHTLAGNELESETTS